MHLRTELLYPEFQGTSGYWGKPTFSDRIEDIKRIFTAPLISLIPIPFRFPIIVGAIIGKLILFIFFKKEIERVKIFKYCDIFFTVLILIFTFHCISF